MKILETKDQRLKIYLSFICCLLLPIFLTGCMIIFQKGRRTDIEKIEELTKAKEELIRVKRELEERLRSELTEEKVRVDLLEKGLVITLVTDEVLFDSGKAKIRSEAYSILDKVADVLIKEVPENYIGIEGHTDNEPIKYSPWKDNWELSLYRAYSVLKYLEDKGIDSERLSARGYGEYQPVASNLTKEGRQLNRRVEIIILPEATKEKLEGKPTREVPIKKEVPPFK